jgi:hypothetical protein
MTTNPKRGRSARRRIMVREDNLEKRIQRALTPVLPRKGYVAVLKARLLKGTRMPVELERSQRINEIVTLTTIGFGALATVAAVATIGIKFASLAGSGALLLNAASKRRSPRSGMKSQTI